MLRFSSRCVHSPRAGAAVSPTCSHARGERDVRLVGRWDITITTKTVLRRPGSRSILQREALDGRMVGSWGACARSQDIVEGDSLRFAVHRQGEDGTGELRVVGRLQGERLVGRMTFPTTAHSTGRRSAPVSAWARSRLGRPHQFSIGTIWEVGSRCSPNQWVVNNGVLSSPRSGVNLRTSRTSAFQASHRVPLSKGEPRGVYLPADTSPERGRSRTETDSHRFSGVYGFIAPSEITARPAGEWQTYDITLVGRMLTVVANGKTVITDQEIPGITGGALDSNEGAPGPLYLQGDHGPIEFRNIVLTPAR